MKKCIIIPSSFKGTLSSPEICSIISSEILKQFPECNIVSLPIADGGQGTVECIKNALNWEYKEIDTIGPFGDPVHAKYVVNDSDNTAVVESAQAAGINLANGNLNPAKASTYGIGLIIKDAINNGYKNIIVALGGSCTCDGGTGCGAALGVKFTDINGKEFIPCGATLNHIYHIDNSECLKFLEGVKISGMCDITNPMHGPNGAASIFAPQKGADTEMTAMLDRNMEFLDMKFKSELNKDIAKQEGSGACGCLGAGILAMFNGRLRSGINHMLDIMNFDENAKDADLIITGEGRLDNLSLYGKSVYGIAQRVKKLGITAPVVAVVGENRLDYMTSMSAGISSVIPISPSYMQYEEMRLHAATNLRNAITKMLYSRGIF